MTSPLVFRILKKDQIHVVKQFIDEDRIIIGNGAEVQIDLSASEVAPIHCIIEKRGSEYFICDLGSAHGTFKNGHQVLDEPIVSGDSFQIGPFNIFFFIGAQKSVMANNVAAESFDSKPKIDDKSASSGLKTAHSTAAIATGKNEKTAAAKNRKLRKTFAPKSEASDLKDYLRAGKGKKIEVIVSWHEHIVNTYHFNASGSKLLDHGGDIEVPVGSAPKDWKLLDFKNGVVINTTPEMQVEILREGQLSPLKDSAYTLNQSEAVFIKLINGMQIAIRFAPQAPAMVFDSPVMLGSSELAGLLAALIIAVMASLIVSVSRPKSSANEEDLERIAQVIFTKPPPPVHFTTAPAVAANEEKKKQQEAEEIRKQEEIKKALLLNEKKESQIYGDPLNSQKKAQTESQSDSGKPAEVKNKNSKLKAKMFTSTKSGGAVKTGDTNGANAQSKEADPNNSGLLAAFGEGGARNMLDKVYSGSGELIGAGEKAKGVSGFNSNRSGEDLGSKIKDTGAGGSGTATQGIAEVGTKGRSNGMSGYGSGTGLGDKDRVQIAVGGSEEDFVGSIDKESVRRVVRSALAQFKACYEKEYRQNTKLEGKVVITWEIHEQGVAKNARIIKDKSTINNTGVEECVKLRMLGLKFPEPPPGTAAVVTYPFIFQGQKL